MHGVALRHLLAFRGRAALVCLTLLAATVLPSATVIAEDLPAYDARTLAALDMLDASEATDQLRDVLDRNRVAIRFVPMAPGIYARYSVSRHVIEIDNRWEDADSATLAAVIAHEATHAQDAVSGNLSAGGGAACIESEIRAFRTSALFWLDLYGRGGKVAPADELEQQLNSIAEHELRDPVGLERLVRQTYSQQCAH
jgi:hypothetical protein